MLVAKWNGPAGNLVKAVEGLDQVTKEGVASHLAVGEDVHSRLFLEPHAFVHGPVFNPFEIGGCQLAGFPFLPGIFQVSRSKQAPNHVAPDGGQIVPAFHRLILLGRILRMSMPVARS